MGNSSSQHHIRRSESLIGEGKRYVSTRYKRINALKTQQVESQTLFVPLELPLIDGHYYAL